MSVESLIPWELIGHGFPLLSLHWSEDKISVFNGVYKAPSGLPPAHFFRLIFHQFPPPCLPKASSIWTLLQVLKMLYSFNHRTFIHAHMWFSLFLFSSAWNILPLLLRTSIQAASSLGYLFNLHALKNIFSLDHWFPFVMINPQPWSFDHLSPHLGHRFHKSRNQWLWCIFVSAVMANSRLLINVRWMCLFIGYLFLPGVKQAFSKYITRISIRPIGWLDIYNLISSNWGPSEKLRNFSTSSGRNRVFQ